ncbi:hypothetical protein OG311_22405 [Streptomyces sp. NBC_01343]|uniref:hypothetical protein n=1 Tax=Streptomyces sp. NBC_01343 TaxID=2903832 RepID=UPI002E150CB3|nr:hypothetical protein OG311_22405 [Streptomyces sp. NBC_01343]
MQNPLLRAPDWDQHADRDALLTDPVLTVRQLGRFTRVRTVPTRIDHALVCSTARGAYDAYLPPHRPRAAGRRYTAVYEVDMGIHPVRTRILLPSSDDAHEFEVTVEIDWQVTDPVLFVRSGHRDVPRLLLGALERAARPVTRQFPISASDAAESAVLAAVQKHGPLGEDVGLRAGWTVRVRRDALNIEHARRLQDIEQRTTEDIEAKRGQLEVQEYEAKRIAFYREYLDRGGIDAWAMHLAQRPEDSKEAMTALTEDHRSQLTAQLDLVKAVLDKGGAEPFELEAIRRLSISAAHGILGQFVPREPPLDAPTAQDGQDGPR